MVHNRDEFLREVTLRICSSLDMRIALGENIRISEGFFFQRMSAFFRYWIPILPLCVIWRTLLPKKILNPPRKISSFSLQRIYEFTLRSRKPYLVHRDNADSLIRLLAEIVSLKDNQDIVLPLLIDSKPLGHIVLRTKGGGREINEEHLKLIQVVQRPLSIAMSNALAHQKLVRYRDMLLDDNRFLANELLSELPKNIIGADKGLSNVMEMVEKVAPLSNIVLLLGETGAGKEVIANAIHYSSPRNKGTVYQK